MITHYRKTHVISKLVEKLMFTWCGNYIWKIEDCSWVRGSRRRWISRWICRAVGITWKIVEINKCLIHRYIFSVSFVCILPFTTISSRFYLHLHHKGYMFSCNWLLHQCVTNNSFSKMNSIVAMDPHYYQNRLLEKIIAHAVVEEQCL